MQHPMTTDSANFKQTKKCKQKPTLRKTQRATFKPAHQLKNVN